MTLESREKVVPISQLLWLLALEGCVGSTTTLDILSSLQDHDDGMENLPEIQPPKSIITGFLLKKNW